MADTTRTGTTGTDGTLADGPAFLAELAHDNTREFWTANAHRYRATLLEPLRALAAALTEEFGPPRVFRPHVDRRFRPRADPYRTDSGVAVTGPGGTPYAVVLSAVGLVAQVGYQAFEAGQLRRYRTAVDGAPGVELEEVLAGLRRDGLVTDGIVALTGRPRGCPPDHPRLPLMRLRGLHVDRAWPVGPWLGTGLVVERVRAAWRAARPLAEWLAVHVGPRDEPAVASRSPAVAAGRPPADGSGT